MDPRRPLTGAATFEGLAAHVLTRPARLGLVRLVCTDGPAGSGKTTFAGRLTDALGEGTELVSLEGCTRAGRWTAPSPGCPPVCCSRWPRGAPAPTPASTGRAADSPPERVPVPVPRVLVVEGCGSCARFLDRWSTLRVWVETPAPLRPSRGLARDGRHLAEHWRRWQESEAAHFAAEDTRARADVRVDGGARPPDGEFVVLD